MDIHLARALLAQVSYPGYSFHIEGAFATPEPTFLQARFKAPDNDAPEVTRIQHTRKWLLSPFMTPSELVQTAFKCVLTSVEHEARELFTYGGARVFGPHFDIEALAALDRARMHDTRDAPAAVRVNTQEERA